MRARWLAFLLFAACGDLDVQDPGPLMIDLSAPASANVNTEVQFNFTAGGSSLEGIALFYGDGTVDSIATFRARTAAGNRKHAYTTAGSYKAVVTVLESNGQSASDSVFVEITPTAASQTVRARGTNR